MKRVLGVDIGGTKCAVVLAEAGEEICILRKIRFDTCAEKGFGYAKEKLFEAIEAIIKDTESIHAIGVSCGGPLDSVKGVIQSPPNLPGWDDIPMTAMLEEAFGVPAFLQNDANACALAEWKYGAGRGTEDMVFLTMGTGMGAGIISGGRLLRGARDLAGEVGHIRLRRRGPVGYNKEGSFEGFASGGGISRLAEILRDEWTKAGDAPAWTDSPDTKRLAESARMGDRHAMAVFEAAGGYLGEGIAIIADVLDPEMIVIGGVFMRCEDLIKKTVWETVQREALPGIASELKIVPARLGENIGDIGAVMAALYGMENQTR
ncbi:MAG: ROK family protein [Clostridia bacterium]|nr:ROK family protein [Clostridia bacterium]